MNREITYWANDAIFYHIYPLGLCGAPLENDFVSDPVERLQALHSWIPHIKSMGCNALYLGPVFESDFHGYDTASYFDVDRRLGTNETLKKLSAHLRENGIKLVLDTVFNHVGRNFWAFKDLQQHGENSKYKDWFAGVDFSRQSTYGDNFAYEGWFDAYNLVKLNLSNPEVKAHLFAAVAMWMDEFGVEGLRLDVAEIMDKEFLAELADFCRSKQPDCWLMGEVINGDYNHWANDAMLDSTTNYEAYKGLYSSHNDTNYFEIAHTLNRQFGEQGIYNGLLLYNFVDNHDTSRVISILHNEAHLYPIYAILYTMPGIPSVYYGSEWGIRGVKGAHDDTMLRPAVNSIPDIASSPLAGFVQQLARIRKSSAALKLGSYRQLYVTHEQLVFSRDNNEELVIVALNIANDPTTITISFSQDEDMELNDVLNEGYKVAVKQQELVVHDIPANGLRILTALRFSNEVTDY